MQVTLDNGATLSVGDNGIGTYSSGMVSTPVKLLSLDPAGAGYIIQKLNDGSVYQQKGIRAIRQNILTKQYFQPRYLGQGPDVRRGFPARGIKSQPQARGVNRAIAPEFRPAWAGWIFRQAKSAAPALGAQSWQITSDEKFAPQITGEEVTLLSFTVPAWAKMRLTAHVQFLEEGSSNENKLSWLLRIGGMDVLNPFQSGDTYSLGRILRSNGNIIPFAIEDKDTLVFGPSTVIEYVVRGVGIIDNTDHIAASLIGTLWGDKT